MRRGFRCINLPYLPYEKIKGIKVTRMGRSRFVEKFHKRLDPRGRTYYWLDGELEVHDEGDDIDIHAVRDGYVSITPIHLDLTAHEHLKSFQGLETFVKKGCSFVTFIHSLGTSFLPPLTDHSAVNYSAKTAPARLLGFNREWIRIGIEF